jgi:NaMN:DMB phosphoribosyltransferase
MQMHAKVTGVHCMLAARMLLAGAVTTAAATANCSAVPHTLAMYVASVLLATDPPSRSIAGHV